MPRTLLWNKCSFSFLSHLFGWDFFIDSFGFICLDRCCPYGTTCGQNNTCCLDGVCAKSDTFFCASTDETGPCQMWQICAFSHSGFSIIGAINATGVCNPKTEAVCTELGFVWCAGACYEESTVCSESFYPMKIPDKASGIFLLFFIFFLFFRLWIYHLFACRIHSHIRLIFLSFCLLSDTFSVSVII